MLDVWGPSPDLGHLQAGVSLCLLFKSLSVLPKQPLTLYVITVILNYFYWNKSPDAACKLLKHCIHPEVVHHRKCRTGRFVHSHGKARPFPLHVGRLSPRLGARRRFLSPEGELCASNLLRSFTRRDGKQVGAEEREQRGS